MTRTATDRLVRRHTEGGYQGAEACSANAAMDQLCATYNDEQLELLADFLRRTTDAGRAATEQLAGG
jgi:hypothetical protein